MRSGRSSSSHACASGGLPLAQKTRRKTERTDFPQSHSAVPRGSYPRCLVRSRREERNKPLRRTAVLRPRLQPRSWEVEELESLQHAVTHQDQPLKSLI
ncbi:hypothetical protein GN956_G16842 [Arapaima gigas]